MKIVWNSLLLAFSLIIPLTVAPTLAEPAATEQQSSGEVSPASTTEITPSSVNESELPEANLENSSEVSPSAPTDNNEAGGEDITQEKNPTPSNPSSNEAEAQTGTQEEQPTPSEPDHSSPTNPDPINEENSENPAAEPTHLEILAEADRLYLAGDLAAAEKLYRQVKPPFPGEIGEGGIRTRLDALYDPSLLTPAGRVYWREAQAGIEKNLETRIFIPLERLTEEYPEFIPGHLLFVKALEDYNRLEKAVEVIERATTFYPNEPDLIKAKVRVLAQTKHWLEASIAARQFALLNPDHPEAEEFARLADENYEEFRSYLRKLIAGNAIANVLTGTLSVVITGNPLGALSAVETLILLAQGESSIGERFTEQAKEELDMVEDEEVLAYINDLGQKLANVAGRNDFQYEFYVILDDQLNAFALPGGKVFVNAGAILYTQSEAELAGLLTHELAHAVLSHGFQLVTHGNLVDSLARYLPLGGTLTNLLVLDYSRDMEQQADVLGTRMLAAAGYSADGLRNLMVTLKEKYGGGSSILEGLSSHPLTDDRIAYLESLIIRGGYNRYGFEGVERHQKIRKQVAKLLGKEIDKNGEIKDVPIDPETETQEEGEEQIETPTEDSTEDSNEEEVPEQTPTETPNEVPNTEAEVQQPTPSENPNSPNPE